MKIECKYCKHSVLVHPFKIENGNSIMNCKKHNIEVTEHHVSDCFEKFIGWHYRENNM